MLLQIYNKIGLGVCFSLFLLPLGSAFADDELVGTQDKTELVFTFAGDLMAHNTNFNMKGYDRIYENLYGLLASDDLSFANLETPLVNDRPYQTFPNFNVHNEYVNAAIRGGFDVFSLANNHSFDQGKTGTKATYLNMTSLALQWSTQGRPIYFSGLRSPLEPAGVDPQLTVFEVKGIKIGFVAFTEFLNIGNDDGKTYLYDFNLAKKKEKVLTFLQKIRPTVDVLFVSYHTGVEYQHAPTKELEKLANDLAKIPVDIFWTHHPHVLQPWKLLDKKGGGKTLFMASMGNFVSGQTAGLGPGSFSLERAWTGDSALMRITLEIDKNPINNTTVFKKIEPVLIGTYLEPRGGAVVWPYELLVAQSTKRWRPFYAYRLKQLLKFYPQSQASHDTLKKLPPLLLP